MHRSNLTRHNRRPVRTENRRSYCAPKPSNKHQKNDLSKAVKPFRKFTTQVLSQQQRLFSAKNNFFNGYNRIVNGETNSMTSMSNKNMSFNGVYFSSKRFFSRARKSQSSVIPVKANDKSLVNVTYFSDDDSSSDMDSEESFQYFLDEILSDIESGNEEQIRSRERLIGRLRQNLLEVSEETSDYDDGVPVSFSIGKSGLIESNVIDAKIVDSDNSNSVNKKKNSSKSSRTSKKQSTKTTKNSVTQAKVLTEAEIASEVELSLTAENAINKLKKIGKQQNKTTNSSQSIIDNTITLLTDTSDDTSRLRDLDKMLIIDPKSSHSLLKMNRQRMHGLSAPDIVSYLDSHVIAQAEAKKALAIAVRNRERRFRIESMQKPTGIASIENFGLRLAQQQGYHVSPNILNKLGSVDDVNDTTSKDISSDVTANATTTASTENNTKTGNKKKNKKTNLSPIEEILTAAPATSAEKTFSLENVLSPTEIAQRNASLSQFNMKYGASLSKEINPFNILLVGPTGSGKTELIKRLSQLLGSPYVHADATRYTETGVVGNDVDQIVTNLYKDAMERERALEKTKVFESSKKRAISTVVYTMLRQKDWGALYRYLEEKGHQHVLQNDNDQITPAPVTPVATPAPVTPAPVTPAPTPSTTSAPKASKSGKDLNKSTKAKASNSPKAKATTTTTTATKVKTPKTKQQKLDKNQEQATKPSDPETTPIIDNTPTETVSQVEIVPEAKSKKGGKKATKNKDQNVNIVDSTNTEPSEASVVLEPVESSKSATKSSKSATKSPKSTAKSTPKSTAKSPKSTTKSTAKSTTKSTSSKKSSTSTDETLTDETSTDTQSPPPPPPVTSTTTSASTKNVKMPLLSPSLFKNSPKLSFKQRSQLHDEIEMTTKGYAKNDTTGKESGVTTIDNETVSDDKDKSQTKKSTAKKSTAKKPSAKKSPAKKSITKKTKTELADESDLEIITSDPDALKELESNDDTQEKSNISPVVDIVDTSINVVNNSTPKGKVATKGNTKISKSKQNKSKPHKKSSSKVPSPTKSKNDVDVSPKQLKKELEENRLTAATPRSSTSHRKKAITQFDDDDSGLFSSDLEDASTYYNKVVLPSIQTDTSTETSSVPAPFGEKKTRKTSVQPKKDDAKSSSLVKKISPTDTTSAQTTTEKPVYTTPTIDQLTKWVNQGILDDFQLEISVPVPTAPKLNNESGFQAIIPGGELLLEELDSHRRPKMTNKKLPIATALETLTEHYQNQAVNDDDLHERALANAERNGIIFIDEIDKLICTDNSSTSKSKGEGVQREMLSLLQGKSIKKGNFSINTENILFICAGAFHHAAPAALLPELQGRLPVIARLDPLTQQQLALVLTLPVYSVLKQYMTLMKADGIDIQLADEAILEIAKCASELNERSQNLGARRLHNIINSVFGYISYNYANGKQLEIDDLGKVRGVINGNNSSTQDDKSSVDNQQPKPFISSSKAATNSVNTSVPLPPENIVELPNGEIQITITAPYVKKTLEHMMKTVDMQKYLL